MKRLHLQTKKQLRTAHKAVAKLLLSHGFKRSDINSWVLTNPQFEHSSLRYSIQSSWANASFLKDLPNFKATQRKRSTLYSKVFEFRGRKYEAYIEIFKDRTCKVKLSIGFPDALL
jgi:hypothetical protein